MWTVVHFLNDNSVEPVPSYWVSRDKKSCFWPNNSGNVHKFRKNRTKPNAFEFTSYECRVLSKNNANFLQAQEQAKKGLYTSDISDGDYRTENRSKRKCAVSLFGNSKYGNQDNKIDPNNQNSDEIVNKKSKTDFNNKIFDENVNQKNRTDLNSQNSDLSSYDDSDSDKDYNPSIKSFENNQIESDFENSYTHKSQDVQIPNLRIAKDDDLHIILPQKEKTAVNDNGDATIARINDNTILTQTKDNTSIDLTKKIMSYLVNLKYEISKIADTQQEILETLNNVTTRQPVSQNDDPYELDYFITNWPISCDDGLLDLENKMKTDRNFYKSVVNELARLGGKTLSRIINKMLKKVFDDSVLIKFTYYGMRKKDSFQLLTINKAIFEAVRKSKQKAATDEDIILSIGKYMTGAKGRMKEKQNNN